MERDFGFNPYSDYMPPIPPNGMDNTNDIYKDPFFNPMTQYEQGYLYYRFLCMQMDYKIKCKEYEKLDNNNSSVRSNPNIDRK